MNENDNAVSNIALCESRKVLIVDDSKIEREMLVSFLRDDYDIIEVSGGKEAMSILESQGKQISAVVLDILMPEMDGYEVIKEMRKNRVCRQIPVIVTTSLDDNESHEKALKCGANGFISKPFNKYLLLYLLKNSIKLREAATLENAMRFDSLTGLLNREAFFTEASRLISLHEPGYFVLACFDVENFKAINDRYGTSKGDEVLKHIADTLNGFFTGIGGLTCRFNADKFAILYPEKYRCSDLILENHKETMSPDCISKKIRIRIGRYLVDDMTLSVSAMFDRAALAEESIKGRFDTYIAEFSNSMRENFIREQRIVNDMLSALNDGEFEPWFQPQYDHTNGKMIGAEALVRWKKDERLISPAEFIPVFERNGFIYEMDQYIWDKVCFYIRKWLDEGRKVLPISVNISRCDMFHKHFIKVLTDIVKKYNVPYSLLRLEVTESAFSDSSKVIISKVNELIELGFTVEIDDFGSGYSSLNTLKDVPATILKLDMRFFENTQNTQRSGSIIEAVVRMAKWLGMTIIAEGVEEKNQADYLKSINCNFIQGFYYAKPMPADEYIKAVENGEIQPSLEGVHSLDSLDNNEFWNPKSMETLIFNSYVGGACIFEYYGDRVELLRTNEQYKKELGAFAANGSVLYKNIVGEYFDDENRKLLFENMLKAKETGIESTTEVVMSDGEKSEYIQTTVRLIAQTEERYLFYGVIVNMTEFREMQRREHETSERLRAVLEHAGNGITAMALRGDTQEFLFANDKYFEIVGYSREQYAEITRDDMFAQVHPDDREELRRKVKGLNKISGSLTVEYRIKRFDGRYVTVHSVITVTVLRGSDVPVQIAVFSDITKEKETNEQLHFLNSSAREILAQPDSEKALNETIAKLMKYFSADRGYIFELDYAHGVSDNTYEVCADGVESKKKMFMGVPLCDIQVCLEQLKNRGYYILDDIETMEKSEEKNRKILEARNASSIVLSSLWRDGELIGFVGVDNPKEAHKQVGQLSAIGDYIAVLLTRRDLNKKIHFDYETMETLMNDTPGGFCRIAIHSDAPPSIINVNEGFCKMLCMTREEVMESYGSDAYKCLELSDLMDSLADSPADVCTGDRFNAKCRLRKKGGGYLWVALFGRFVTVENGDVFLNSYFTDISEQKSKEQQQIELLDNLPCGAGLYLYDGKEITAIHINKRYSQLVGRSLDDLTGHAVWDNIHPNDRRAVADEVRDAIENKRAGACNIKVLCGNGNYRSFHVDAWATSVGEGKYLLYVSYTVLPERELNFRESLPFILSSMMESSTDITFAKDREFRYLCCSKTFAEFLGLKSAEEVVGKTDYELFSQQIADKFRHDDSVMLASEKPLIDIVELLPSPDGKMHYTKASKHLMRNATGEIIGLYGVGRDITETRETYAQLKLMTESIPSGLVTYACTKDSFRVTYCNSGFCALFGTTQENFDKIVTAKPLDFVFDEDREKLLIEYRKLLKNGTPLDCIYRIHVKGGGYKWVHHSGVIAERTGETFFVNSALLDITEQQETLEKLRVSEELNRLAIEHSGSIITKYDVKKRKLSLPVSFNPIFVLPQVLNNMPSEQIKLGRISPETADVYAEMFENIAEGSKSGTVTYQQNSTKGWRWLEAQYTTVFSNSGQPVSAVISFTDITEKLEKEVVYNKWQQSLSERSKESYTLFRCNLSRGASYDSREGTLISLDFMDKKQTFDAHTSEYVSKCVLEADRKKYYAFMNADTLLAEYYRGHRSHQLEYREITGNTTFRWLRLSIDLVEYPNSKDVEVYLMYENIDNQKKQELLTIRRSETDPLTGILNRSTFISRIEDILSVSRKDEKHALLMLDVDNFKFINDTMGHGVGDRVLLELTQNINSVLRISDIVGRLGGDEFFIFLRNISNKRMAEKKAAQICSLGVSLPDSDKKVNVSVGIAMIPRDGNDFDTLYKKVDNALYCEKRHGKGGYLFVSDCEK